MRKPCLAWFIAGALALGSSVAAQAQSAGAMTQLPEGACLALSAAIPPSVIGLPTSGAVIESATLHGPSDVTVTERAPTPASRVTPATPATCRVFGRIAPVDLIRLFTAPGVDHVGSGAPAHADMLEALDAWVDRGTTPADLTLVEQEVAAPSFTTKRSLPLCEWPMWPRHTGSDPTKADSFQCTR